MRVSHFHSHNRKLVYLVDRERERGGSNYYLTWAATKEHKRFSETEGKGVEKKTKWEEGRMREREFKKPCVKDEGSVSRLPTPSHFPSADSWVLGITYLSHKCKKGGVAITPLPPCILPPYYSFIFKYVGKKITNWADLNEMKEFYYWINFCFANNLQRCKLDPVISKSNFRMGWFKFVLMREKFFLWGDKIRLGAHFAPGVVKW